MTDIEMETRCAQAMGYTVERESDHRLIVSLPYFDSAGTVIGHCPARYDPLTLDAQAMALVKRRCLHIDRGVEHPNHSYPSWRVLGWAEYRGTAMTAWNRDLNRAICECVAKMQANTGAGER